MPAGTAATYGDSQGAGKGNAYVPWLCPQSSDSSCIDQAAYLQEGFASGSLSTLRAGHWAALCPKCTHFPVTLTGKVSYPGFKPQSPPPLHHQGPSDTFRHGLC